MTNVLLTRYLSPSSDALMNTWSVCMLAMKACTSIAASVSRPMCSFSVVTRTLRIVW